MAIEFYKSTFKSNRRQVPNVIKVVESRVVIRPVHSLNSACFTQSFRRPKHAVKSISKRINNLRNEDIKFAKRPPHANRVERKKCPRPQPSLSNFWFLNGFEWERTRGVGYGLRGSEREGVGSCVRLSESVPAFAIKSGRAGAGEARVLKCSLRRVGFCLPRAVSERLFDYSLAVRFASGVRQSHSAAAREHSRLACYRTEWQWQRGDRALFTWIRREKFPPTKQQNIFGR